MYIDVQHGHDADCTDIMDTNSASEDPILDDTVVVISGMKLLASFRPPIVGEIEIGRRVTFKGTLTKMADTNGGYFPKRGTLTVMRPQNQGGTVYQIDAFENTWRGFNLTFAPSVIDVITWTSDDGTQTTFRPDNPKEQNMITPEVQFWCVIDKHGGANRWGPHLPRFGYCGDANIGSILCPGTLIMNVGKSNEVKFEMSSEIGVRLFDGHIVSKYHSGVTADVHAKTGVLTWTAKKNNIDVGKFECLHHAAMMHDIITFYTNPSISRLEYNTSPPTPERMSAPEWQQVMNLPNVMRRFQITKTPTTKIGARCLEFALRMNICLAVNALITPSDEPSLTSVHGPLFSRVHALVGHVPAAGELRTEGMATLVEEWQLLHASYSESVDARGDPCLKRIVQPVEFCQSPGTLGRILLIKKNKHTVHWAQIYKLGRVAFMTMQNIHDGKMPVFLDGRYGSLDPQENLIFTFVPFEAKEPPTKKRRIAT